MTEWFPNLTRPMVTGQLVVEEIADKLAAAVDTVAVGTAADRTAAAADHIHSLIHRHNLRHR